MIKQLHPTLKKCKCGFIGKRNELYKHLDRARSAFDPNSKNFFKFHGEVPLNVDDPSIALTSRELECARYH